jgi:GNAT superfamily N-acetyltransferase
MKSISLEYAIRPAGPADAEAIARVQDLSWRTTYAGLLPAETIGRVGAAWGPAHWMGRLQKLNSGDFTLVLDHEERGVVGFCEAGPCRGRLRRYDAEFYRLYLIKSVQGQGYGRWLMASAARVLLARGLESGVVWALATNRAACRFYAGIGGKQVDRRWQTLFGIRLPEASYAWSDLNDLAGLSPEPFIH